MEDHEIHKLLEASVKRVQLAQKQRGLTDNIGHQANPIGKEKEDEIRKMVFASMNEIKLMRESDSTEIKDEKLCESVNNYIQDKIMRLEAGSATVAETEAATVAENFCENSARFTRNFTYPGYWHKKRPTVSV